MEGESQSASRREVLAGCKLEPSLKNAAVNEKYQFERLGYFSVDKDSSGGKLVFQSVPVSLERRTYAKETQKGKK